MASMSKNTVALFQAKDAEQHRIKLAHREFGLLVESPIIVSHFDDPTDLWVLGF